MERKLFSFFMGMHHALGRRSLEDVVRIVGLQIRALGHEAVLDKRNLEEDVGKHVYVTRPGSINVLIEGFTPAWIEHLAQAKAQGARFMILATEEPTERGFNWGTQKEMVKRQEIFPEAAKLCEGILHLVPGEQVTRWYGQYAPAAQAELGFAPGLLRVVQGEPEPEYDFGFFGSVTNRRLRILKRLAKLTGRAKAVKVVADFLPGEERDRQMRRAKVIVQIRKFDSMGLVSSSRCNTALSIGRPVVPEPHDAELSKPWDEVITFPRTMDGFYGTAIFARAAWRQVWNDQVSKFAKKMSPEFCVGEPLRRIGILDRDGGKAAA
jgi:hypothetical protein